MTDKNRILERLGNFENAYNRLSESLDYKITNNIVIDGVIHRFEFTFDLAWKLMIVYLEFEGFRDEVISPRGAIRTAFQFGLIEEGNSWIDMMIDSTKTKHLYDEGQARSIYEKIKAEHLIRLGQFLSRIQAELSHDE